MKLGLVLGAGGTVGMAYHAGVLKALAEAGIDPSAADLVIGTSAGSVVGAYLRSGFDADDLWQFSQGVHPRLGERMGPDDVAERRRAIFSPAWASRSELARRALGSAYVMARSVVRFPMVPMPAVLRRQFPGGFFSMLEGERRFAEDLSSTWPERPLWICAVDITSGRRVVFGRARAPQVPLSTAVMASCAIPGVYKPVKVGRYTLVDGGARSTTNLDLAAPRTGVDDGCDVIIGVAPMAYDPASPPAGMARVVRRIPARSLSSEVALAKARGAQVLLIRPNAEQLALHGLNSMRSDDSAERIARAAFEATTDLLRTDRFQQVLAGVH